MLVGNKITLRPLERADLPLLASWRNNPANRSYFFSPYPITLSAQDKWYDAYLARPDSLIMMINPRHSEKPFGMIGLDHIDHRNQTAEYGRLLIADPSMRRMGNARDATLTLLSYAFNDLNINRVYLRVYADNVTALRLYESCGFVREGVERQSVYMNSRFNDVILMSILRPEFKRIEKVKRT